MPDLAAILLNARRAEGFRAFLSARGCELMVATNPYEILRFRRQGRTNVVYKKRSGKLTIVGNDVALAVSAYQQVERRQKSGRQTPAARPVAAPPAGRPARRELKRTKLRGTAYEITAIRAVKSTMKTLGCRRLVLTCRRWEPKEVPAEATVFEFTWNRRTRSRA